MNDTVQDKEHWREKEGSNSTQNTADLHAYDAYIQSLKSENQILKDDIASQSMRVTSLRDWFQDIHGSSSAASSSERAHMWENPAGIHFVMEKSMASTDSPRLPTHSRLADLEKQATVHKAALSQLLQCMRDFKLELMPTINKHLESVLLSKSPPLLNSIQSFTRLSSEENNSGSYIKDLVREWRIVQSLTKTRFESNEMVRRQLKSSNLDLQRKANQLQRAQDRKENEAMQREEMGNEETNALQEQIHTLQQQRKHDYDEFEKRLESKAVELQQRDQTIMELKYQHDRLNERIDTMEKASRDLQCQVDREVENATQTEQELKIERRRNKELQLQLDMLKVDQLEGKSFHNGDSSRVVNTMNELKMENEELKKLTAEQDMYIRRLASASSVDIGPRTPNMRKSFDRDMPPNSQQLQFLSRSEVDPISAKEIELVAEDKLSDSALMTKIILQGQGSNVIESTANGFH